MIDWKTDKLAMLPGGTPYIRMIGMIVVLLGVVIGDLVFLGVVQAKSFKEIKLVFVKV